MERIELLFLQIVNMSITGSYIILAILLIRLILKKAPKNYSFALWGVVAFRLLCPITFSSVFSFFNLNVFNRAAIQSGQNTLIYVPSDIGLMQTPRVASGITIADNIINGSLPIADATASTNPIQLWIFFAAFLWLIGFTGLLIYGIVSYAKVKRVVSSAVLLENNVFETDRLPTPFVLGFIRPKIYLPFRVQDTERAYILQHERYHIRRGDHLIKPLSFLILTVYWFNPLVWLAFYLMCQDMEMSCDEAVLSGMGSSIKRDYSSSLLSLASYRRFPFTSPLAFGESNVKVRIQNVLIFKRPKTWIMTASLLVCVVAIIACASNPQSSAESSMPVLQPVPVTSTRSADQIQTTLLDNASSFVMTILNIPNEQIKRAMDSTNPTNIEAANKETDIAILNLAGDFIAEKTFKDTGSSFYNSVIALHFSAVIQNFTIKPTGVKFTPNATQKNLYSYEATTIFSSENIGDKEIKLIGRIQFDDNGKVNSISIEGNDLNELLKQLGPKPAA